jgi:hypothetical protein
MADRVIFVGWSKVVRGREERALEVFNETVGMYGRMQQEGRIEKLDVLFLDPHASNLDGFFTVYGTAEQLAALREDDEFRRNLYDADLVVEDLRVINGYTGNAVAEEMEKYTESIQKVPQMTG